MFLLQAQYAFAVMVICDFHVICDFGFEFCFCWKACYEYQYCIEISLSTVSTSYLRPQQSFTKIHNKTTMAAVASTRQQANPFDDSDDDEPTGPSAPPPPPPESPYNPMSPAMSYPDDDHVASDNAIDDTNNGKKIYIMCSCKCLTFSE